jgi:hypothetical protein
MRGEGRSLRRALVVCTALAAIVGFGMLGSATAKPAPGFLTTKAPLLAPAAPGVTVKALLNTGDTVGGYTFESLPDGIAVDEEHHGQVNAYVNHETSLVPFGPRGQDFTNALYVEGAVESSRRWSYAGSGGSCGGAVVAARTYVGARGDGAGCLVGALAEAQSPTGHDGRLTKCIGSAPQACLRSCGPNRSHRVGQGVAVSRVAASTSTRRW